MFTKCAQVTARSSDQISEPIITSAPATIPMAFSGCFSTSKNHAVAFALYHQMHGLRTILLWNRTTGGTSP
jgi:hypothetical protein